MLKDMLEKVTNKDNFISLQNYIDFASYFLEYIEKNQQATIVSQNENIYNFFQYGKEVGFRVTRPFNSTILYSFSDFEINKIQLLNDIKQLKEYRDSAAIIERSVINRTIYTLQQSIGFGLDALPANKTNTARKVAGDLFERLIQILFNEIGVPAKSGIVRVPVKDDDGKELFKMNYQHDLIVENKDEELPRLIGSIKTTSKDRFAKVFMDKFLYSKLTETDTPHIAIFLHDVQRAAGKSEGNYRISQTFLTGHFKGYTIKLNALDGVYYLDPRPVMGTDEIMKQHIYKFDRLICDDIWDFIR